MGLNRDAVGAVAAPQQRNWTATQSVIYALGVGCGADELAFATDDTRGAQQRALPTMAVVLALPGRDIADAMGDYDRRMMVHGSQETVIHSTIPVAGTVTYSSTILGIYDKKSGAAVETETRAVDAETRKPMFTNRSVAFIRGEGGWGGDRGPASPYGPLPDRAPDSVARYDLGDNQALIYRLSGDRNPLHSDPEFAKAAGFKRPILHGLCTYGFVGRALLHEVCGGSVDEFGALSARFVAPVYPGDRLAIALWKSVDGAVAFQGTRNDEQVVITGHFRTRTPAAAE